MTSDLNTAAAAIYRIDAFSVPVEARAAFLDRAGVIQALLRKQRGLVGAHAFEREGGPGRFNFVTVAAWADQMAIDSASEAVAALHATAGFDREAFAASNRIASEMATFRALAL